MIAIMAPVYLFTAGSPPAFESKAKMWLAGKLNFNESHLYTEELVNFLGTQAELLRSAVIQRRALARVEKQFTNRTVVTVKSGGTAQFRVVQELKDFWNNVIGPDVAASTNTVPESPFKLKVLESPKSSIVELRVAGPEAAPTRAFLNSLMEEYLDFKREAREKTSDRTVTSVSGQVAQLASELKAQQEKMYAFQMSNNVVFLQEQGNSAGSYLALLNKQLATLRTELQLLELMQPEQWMELGARIKNVDGSEAAPGEAAAKEMLASMAGAQAELFKANQQSQLLKAKRDELSRFLRPQHPKIVKLNEEIATQEKLAQVSRDEAFKQLTHRRQGLQLEIQNLEVAFNDWDAKAIQTSRKMVDYDRIRQDLQRLQAAYDKLLGVIQTVDISKTLDQENMSVLEPATLARPLRRMLRNMLIAFAAALLSGLAFLYLVGNFDDSFASLTELANGVPEPVIGQIPDIALRSPKGRMGMETLEGQRFEFLESFRSIRSSLLFGDNGAVKAKTIVVASSVPKEGKSTVALYLAATMSMGGSRVLLVDGDMRRASLHKNFGAAASPGLAEILSQEISWGQAIIRTPLENLSFLPAGNARRNPGELVLRPQWGQFLSEISSRFDYVLIDTPPVLATDDAPTLATKVDGILFVVRGAQTSARMVREGLEVLHQRGAHVLGLILNRAVSSPYEYHYYERYKDRYSWRPKRAKARTEAAATAKTRVHTTTSSQTAERRG